jgi:hypothetical protein
LVTGAVGGDPAAAGDDSAVADDAMSTALIPTNTEIESLCEALLFDDSTCIPPPTDYPSQLQARRLDRTVITLDQPSTILQ